MQSRINRILESSHPARPGLIFFIMGITRKTERSRQNVLNKLKSRDLSAAFIPKRFPIFTNAAVISTKVFWLG